MPGAIHKTIKIFCCYAHEDELLLNRLKAHLMPLQRQGLIEVWHDRDISAGTEWGKEIDNHLNEAQIILLLISPDFIASDYCYSIEMQRAMKRHESGEAYVIPIILRPVHWHDSPFGKLQALPTDGIAVISLNWHSTDFAFYNIVEEIHKVINRLIETHIIPSDKLSSITRELDAIKKEIPPNITQLSWGSAGAQGELVGSLVNTRQWAQAEAIAQSIQESSKRTSILSKLSEELAKAKEWERAEAVARSTHKDETLINLARNLATAQEWSRAEAVGRSITDPHKNGLILRELSLLFARAGEFSRAKNVAYDADAWVPQGVYPPTSYAPLPPSNRQQMPYGPPLSQSKRHFPIFGCLLLTALAFIVGVVFAAPFIVRWYHTLTVFWLVLLWSVVGVFLLGLVIFILVKVWRNRKL